MSAMLNRGERHFQGEEARKLRRLSSPHVEEFNPGTFLNTRLKDLKKIGYPNTYHNVAYFK